MQQLYMSFGNKTDGVVRLVFSLNILFIKVDFTCAHNNVYVAT